MAETVDIKDRLRVVGTGYVYDSNYRFLILRRTSQTKLFPALWTVPSGGLEEQDYLSLPTVADGWESVVEETTRREIREETGVEVGELTYVNNFVFVRAVDKIPVLGLRFLAPYLSGEVQLDPEDATEFAWITADEVSNYEFLGNIPEQIKWLDHRIRNRA